MLAEWMRRSPSPSPSPSPSRRVHTRSPSFHHEPQTSPFHSLHKPSLSFKDIESLLSLSPGPGPGPPLYTGPSPSRFSLKDVHALLSEDPTPARSHPSIFHRAWAWAQARARRVPPSSKDRVVVYTTTLRVVRRTFEDCRAVRSILMGYRVRLDERDLSMDGAYVEELENVVGERRDAVVKMLPLVFVNGKCIGGVDEVRRMHESGELKRVLQAVPAVKGGGGCGVCGGCRYVVCEHCGGSHKVFVGKIDGFRSCCVCNVCGLVRCPSCSSDFF